MEWNNILSKAGIHWWETVSYTHLDVYKRQRYGILQPLLVQKKGTFYEIIAGERRWRAAKIAGLKEIPVVLREYNKQESMEIALIENVQRADLNPIEEALAYQRLVTEFKLSLIHISMGM